MSSAVNGLGSFDPLTLINSLTASAQSTTAAASTSGRKREGRVLRAAEER